MEVEFVPYKRRKRKTKYTKTGKLRTKTRQELERELWKVFSLFVRKRDGACVQASDGRCQGYLSAGHVIPRGKKPTKYLETNVFAQCGFHNKLHKYHPHIYNAWYVQKFGGEAFSNLVAESLKEGKDPTREECLRMTSLYQSKTPGLA